MQYVGECIDHDEAERREKWDDLENLTYQFTLNSEYAVDSKTMGNEVRFANHSKKNENVVAKVMFSQGMHKVCLFAKRDIEEDEEILFDYDGEDVLATKFSWINDNDSVEVKKNENINSAKKNRSAKSKIKEDESASSFNSYTYSDLPTEALNTSPINYNLSINMNISPNNTTLDNLTNSLTLGNKRKFKEVVSFNKIANVKQYSNLSGLVIDLTDM